MRKALILVAVVALGGIALWGWLGGLDRITEDRVRTALADQGVPPQLAACMAPRMTDQLTIGQLRSLESLKARAGENPVPLSSAEVLERLRRVEDPQAVEVTVRAAASCTLGFPI